MSRNAPNFAFRARRGFHELALVFLCALVIHATATPATQAPSRATVFVIHNPDATVAFRPVQPVVDQMFLQGLTNVTRTTSPEQAWMSLVNTNDVVGIKVFTEPGPNSGTRLAVTAAAVKSLIAAGISPTNIIVWDKHLIHLRLAGYHTLAEDLGIRLAGSSDAGYDAEPHYESSILGTLVWGDLEFGRKDDEVIGRRSHVSRLVTREITKLINITPMRNHNQAGVAGILYSLALGSVDNTRRFESDAERLAVAVPEIYALPVLADRVALNVVDALVCQYEGEERSLLHYSTTLNQLRFSRDPVALDALSIQELEAQRERAKTPRLQPNFQLYSNAELLELGIADPKRIRIVEVD